MCVRCFHPLDKTPPCGLWASLPGSVPCASCQSVLIAKGRHRALPVWGYLSITALYRLGFIVRWAERAFLWDGCLGEDCGAQGGCVLSGRTRL